MSLRLTCKVCGIPDKNFSIILNDIEDIKLWQPYICIVCIEKGYSSKKEIIESEVPDLFDVIKEDMEKGKLGLIRCPLCDSFSPINDVRKKGGDFFERLCDNCKSNWNTNSKPKE